jgi:uncharacterized protein
MRQIFAALLVVAGLLGAARAEVPVPPLKARVTDLTGTLNAQQKGELESRIAAFESKRGSQIAVLLLPTTKPEAIEQYAIRVAEAWKIGRKKVDDGLILVVAKDDRRLRIEVGYGLEGAIPDSVAKRVIDERITPRFRGGDFYGGVRDGVDQLIRLAEGEKLPSLAPAPAAPATAAGLLPWLLPVFFFFAMVGVMILLVARISSGNRGNWSSGGGSRSRGSSGGFSSSWGSSSSSGGVSGGGGSFGGGGASGSW